MGLFGNDKAQDERLDGIEDWLQGLTGVVQQHKLDTTELRLDLMKLQAKVSEKLSGEDFDPMIMSLSNKITEARAMAKEAASAAEEGWSKVQGGVMDALEDLNREMAEAADRLEKE